MKIVIDIDDVLADTMRTMIPYCNNRFGSSATFESYTVPEDYCRLFKITPEELMPIIQAVFTAPDFYPTLPTIAGANEAVRRLKGEHSLLALTSRSGMLEAWTREWLSGNDFKFDEVYIADNWANALGIPSIVNDKGEQYIQLGADVVIDDMTRHVNAAAERGIKAILFGDYPWNQEDVHPDVIRARDWDEVVKIVGSIA